MTKRSLTLLLLVHFGLTLHPFAFILGLDLSLDLSNVLSDFHNLLHYLLLLLTVTHYIVGVVGDARGQMIGLMTVRGRFI